jgi:hypothetical protein
MNRLLLAARSTTVAWARLRLAKISPNILAIAAGLSDQDLLARLHLLARTEREASVELVAHLAALDTRPAVYAAQAYACACWAAISRWRTTRPSSQGPAALPAYPSRYG